MRNIILTKLTIDLWRLIQTKVNGYLIDEGNLYLDFDLIVMHTIDVIKISLPEKLII